ncbi:MAG: hypothetical protein HKN72_00335 [Gemmatimonadetes bacterium]|nr:hypothetical protein [Gemmatimonadota bacterium]NNL29764.1 hypothetical protein [Gemmatimonadota bacterium]
MSAADQDLTQLLDALDGALNGRSRGEVLDGMRARGDFVDWMGRLRGSMSEHRFVAGAERFDVAHLVRRLDVRTRKDGFRVLHSWNHRTHEFTEDMVPVLMVDFFLRAGPKDPDPAVVLSILLDYYFLHLLALCAMRAWDAGDPDLALARVQSLLEALQGEDGSGHQFVDDAETLLIYALSQFHPEEQAYDRIITRVAELGSTRRLAFARVSASVLSAHLRWGFWLMYGRDVVRMRADNVGDYPWLLDVVVTLLRGWVEAEEAGAPQEDRDHIAESLLQGLAADPWAFTGSRPPAFAAHSEACDEVSALLEAHAPSLLEAFERHKPTKTEYAPLAFHFNFPHNALVAVLTLALLEGRPQPLPLNVLFTREMEGLPEGETQEGLARTLMAFSKGRPDRLGNRGEVLVAYDPLSAMRSYSMTTKALRKRFAEG